MPRDKTKSESKDSKIAKPGYPGLVKIKPGLLFEQKESNEHHGNVRVRKCVTPEMGKQRGVGVWSPGNFWPIVIQYGDRPFFFQHFESPASKGNAP